MSAHRREEHVVGSDFRINNLSRTAVPAPSPVVWQPRQGNGTGANPGDRVKLSLEVRQTPAAPSPVASLITSGWNTNALGGESQRPGIHQGFTLNSQGGLCGLTPGMRAAGVYSSKPAQSPVQE